MANEVEQWMARWEEERRGRRRAEERAIAAERALLEALGAQAGGGRAGVFLAQMSHEIRTPLSAIVGYASLIAGQVREDAALSAWSRRLERAAEYLLGLLDDVLDLAKIEAGKLTLHVGDVAIVSVLEEVGALMEPRALERGLELTIGAETELPAKIRSDGVRLGQILVNLVHNAIKYTQNGSVTLGARFIDGPGRGVTGRFVRFDVSDTGPGISPEEVARLFEPFEQLQGARPHGGVGLGLDIAKRLARLLGGDVTVTSEVGVGSVFSLILPCAAEEGAVTTPARVVTHGGVGRPVEGEPWVPRLDGVVVLVVDDTEDNLMIISAFLRAAGAEVVEAGSLAAAQEVLAGRAVTVVVTDVQLGDGDGIAWAAELGERSRGAAEGLATLVLTADAMRETRERAHAAGVDGFMVKPVLGRELVARVAALSRAVRGRKAGARPVAARGGEAAVTRRGGTRGGDHERVGSDGDVKTPGQGRARPEWGSEGDVKTPGQGRARPEWGSDGDVKTPGQGRARPEWAPGAGPASVQALIGRRRPSGRMEAVGAAMSAGAPQIPLKLLENFYEHAGERANALHQALECADWVGVCDIAHRVAGSGGTMGHPELTELGRLVEQTVKSESGSHRARQLALSLATLLAAVSRARRWCP